VLWPGAGLERPPHRPGTNVTLWGADAVNASAAQILRTFFGIRF
jgi:hypothetical protein